MQYAKVYSNTGVLLDVLPNAKVGYTLKMEPLSTGKLVLPVEDDGNALCTAYNQVELYDADARVDLFRVIGMPQSSIRFGGSCTYKLEHVLATLMDNIMPGYKEIGGTGMDMAACIHYILGYQTTPRWQLGRCDFTTQFQYSFSNAYLLNALLALPKQLSEDYVITTDTTTTPWTLNIVRPSTTITCELRYRHNMEEIGKTYDASDLCTRCYPYGYGEGVNQLTVRSVNSGRLYIDADTIGTWGVVEKPFVDATMEQPQALLGRAWQWLTAYKNPRISYTIKAIDLTRLTGEPMDQFAPGKLCRVNDQEHGVLVSVRVTQISKDDPVGKPDAVTVTLANSSASVANDIADLASRASINELYAQGATNLFQLSIRDNADKDHPITVPVDIVEECVRINKLRLQLHIGNFRSYTQGTAAGGGTVTTTSAGGAQEITKPVTVNISNNTTGNPKDMSTGYTKSNTDLETARDTGASTLSMTGSAGAYTYTGEATGNTGYATASHVHDGNSHRHFVNATNTYSSYATFTTDTSDNTLHVHSMNGHTHLTGAHAHSMSHAHGIPVHAHGMDHYHMLNLVISIPALSITIWDHVHSMTLPTHAHADNPGIYDGPTVSTVTVKVDGTAVPASAITGGEVDLIPYLSKDAAGKVVRGSHTILLTPVATSGNAKGLCMIEGSLSAVVFVRSQGGGDY